MPYKPAADQPRRKSGRSRKPQAKTAARGYGFEHRQLRDRLLAQLKASPGQPCPRCGQPMTAEQKLDLGHNDDRTGYHGLEHRRCNRQAAAHKVNAQRAAQGQAADAPFTSRW